MSMRKMFLMFMALAALTMVLPAAQASAETITWPDSGVLQPDPLGWGTDDCLFPAELSDNIVTVNDDVPGVVFGGVSDGDEKVMNNSVTLNSGTVGSSILGGYSDSGEVTGNSVTVTGGTAGNDVRGGVSNGGGNATDNSVTINGGTVNGLVLGGWSNLGDAAYNTVTISGSPEFDSVNTSLFGGAGFDSFTGNTLNVENYSEITPVLSVTDFEFFNFTFPSTQTDPVLTTSSFTYLGDGATGSTVTVNTAGGGLMPVGSSVTLIEAGTLTLNGFTQTQAGGAGYLWDLEVIGNDLIATVAKTLWVGPQDGTLTEGEAGSAAFEVTTEGIADGSAIALDNINSVAGISLDPETTETTDDDTAVIINTTEATPAGSHPLTLTIDGVTSAEFYLKVNKPGLEPIPEPEPGPKPKPRGGRGGCLNTGAGMAGMLTLALLAALRKGKKP